ncbi:DUF4249 domain-containing protein [Parabacteroides sp. Marseille-P3160]|uniref:DUF4249 domain-containing protein n=1 Tax=Parabacteroides sp. Marseille-P3160 TaxID=1917887 RepID=UPI0009B9B25D|nr:DUF4249 domain-containing protein [Parabacteroides sp. Marseille-P3160]
MKRKIFQPVFYTLIYILLTGCTADIDIKTNDSEPVIVIYGLLTNEYKKQSVRLTRSSPYFSQEKNEAVSGAVVRITSSLNEEFNLMESQSEKGTYETTDSLSAKAGITYRLNIQVDFDGDGIVDTYEAETVMQPAISLDSIRIKPLRIMGESYYALNLYATDSPDEDYYICNYFVNDTLKTDRISRYRMLGDEIVNGEYINGLTIEYFLDRKEAKKHENEDNFDDLIFVSPGDHITIEMNKVEKSYYLFIIDCQMEMKGENPFFGGPASNIRTNISKGGTGFFSAYTINRIEASVPADETN